MHRRAFFSLLSGLALDPERMLWVPGRRLISIPKPSSPLSRYFHAFVRSRVPDAELVEAELRKLHAILDRDDEPLMIGRYGILLSERLNAQVLPQAVSDVLIAGEADAAARASAGIMDGCSTVARSSAGSP